MGKGVSTKVRVAGPDQKGLLSHCRDFFWRVGVQKVLSRKTQDLNQKDPSGCVENSCRGRGWK